MNAHIGSFEATIKAEARARRIRLWGETVPQPRVQILPRPKKKISPSNYGLWHQNVQFDPTIEPELTEAALRPLENVDLPYGPPELITDIEAYIAKRCEKFGIHPEDLSTDSQAQYIVRYRYILFYEVRCATWSPEHKGPMIYRELSKHFWDIKTNTIIRGTTHVASQIDRMGSYKPWDERKNRALLYLARNMDYIKSKRYSVSQIAKIFGVSVRDVENAHHNYRSGKQVE